ncbi:uncharacterized protein LOC123477480 [Daphnia magna]|uniref:uncharacterized protein LOC123477480 n=1 Tax=Daphnia magna TaxID=35525 RepID=UPI001E1BAF20|nr:uncharacterized protein LOC123477480 [Daphnia magna]
MGSKSVLDPTNDEESLSNSKVGSSGPFQVGRLHVHWMGTHRLEDTSGHSVNDLTSMNCVPTTWLSQCMKFMLYPPVGSHSANGKNQEPSQWRSNVFKRFRYPTNSWFEYDVVQVFNASKPGSHDRVYKSASAAMKGSKTFEDLLKSDNDEWMSRKKKEKASEVKEVKDAPAAVIGHGDEGQSILPDAGGEISAVVARAVFPLLSDNWNVDKDSNDEETIFPLEPTSWVEQGEQSATPEFHGTMMNLDTHQLCPSLSPSLNGPTGNTSTNGTTGMTFDQSMMFRLLNAIERVTSLENAIGTIEANVSATLALILEKLGALDQKIEAIRKVKVYKMAEVDFDYHKSVIDTHFKELPVKSTNAVEAIDFSLQDNTLAISLVFFYVEKFKTVKTVNKLFYLMLDFLVSKEVSNKMQWKMMPRGKDSRPGMAGLFNLLAVFGVAARTFAKKRRTVK